MRGGRLPRWVKRVADALRVMPVLHNDTQGKVSRPVACCSGVVDLKRQFARWVRRRMRDDVELPACRRAMPIARPMANGCYQALHLPNVEFAKLVPIGSALGAHGGPGMLVVGLQEYEKPGSPS